MVSVSFVTLTRGIENNIKELEALQKSIPHPACTTSYGLGWKGLEAVRYRRDSANAEFTLPAVSYHSVVLISRPPENWYVRYEGVERQTPPPVGSIALSGSNEHSNSCGPMATSAWPRSRFALVSRIKVIFAFILSGSPASRRDGFGRYAVHDNIASA